jgi:hypothetical protein
MPFVSVRQHPPPANCTILARYGSAYIFVAFSRALDKWSHIANGRETEIGAPLYWWSSDGDDATPADDIDFPLSSQPKQLTLAFDDSKMPSNHAQ